MTGNLPSPPFISVPGLPNFRDAGGYEVISDPPNTSAEGKRKTKMVRRGILFRSSEVGLLLLHGRVPEQELRNQGLSTVVVPSGSRKSSLFLFRRWL